MHPIAPFSTGTEDLPIYSASYKDCTLAVAPCPVGSPVAAALLEELIARGGSKFVVCGGAAVLDPSIAAGDIVIPTSAVRDEGTSYHYLPPMREVTPTMRVVNLLKDVVEEHQCRYVVGKTWTTDGIYRETRGKIKRRRQEGCITAEMEASALFAVAQFRAVEISLLLSAGDDVSGSAWDPRDFGRNLSAREKLFWLAAETCVRL
jgi:uridine phosphorylase